MELSAENYLTGWKYVKTYGLTQRKTNEPEIERVGSEIDGIAPSEEPSPKQENKSPSKSKNFQIFYEYCQR